MLVKNQSLQKLKLKPLPYTDLNARYALIMGNGMIKHYSVSLPNRLTTDEKPEDLILKDIRAETGMPDLEIELVPADPNFLVTNTVQQLTQETFLSLLDPDVRTAFTSYNASSSLRQYNKNIKGSGKYPFLAPLDKVVNFLIRKLQPFFSRPYPDLAGLTDEEFMSVRWDMQHNPYKSKFHGKVYGLLSSIGYSLTVMANKSYVRAVAPAWYLVAAFEEKDLDKALEALAQDLNLIGKNFDIMGNMAVANLVPLANKVGNGEKVLALLVSPFVNVVDRLPPEIWMAQPDKFEQYIRDLGVKYNAREGEVIYLNGKDPYSDLVIGESKHLGEQVTFIDDSDPMSEGLGIESVEAQEALEAGKKKSAALMEQIQALQKALEVSTITPEELDKKFGPKGDSGN